MNTKSMNKAFATMIILIVCYGCAPVMTSGTQAIKNEKVMNQIKPGITDKNTVYQLLGAPMGAHNSPSGETWMYHYSEVNRKFLLIGWGGIFDSTIDSQSTMINITFDDRNLVKSISGRPIPGYGTPQTKYESKPLPSDPVPVKKAISLQNKEKNVSEPLTDAKPNNNTTNKGVAMEYEREQVEITEQADGRFLLK